jgi:hypothetical protein
MNYAQIVNGVVVNVIVADADFVATQTDKTYVEYTGSVGIGFTYDGTNFIAPQPYPSWTLDSNYDWQAPTPKPDGDFYWNEDTQTWVQYDKQKN